MTAKTYALNITADQRMVLRRAMTAEVKRIQRELDMASYATEVREPIQERLEEAQATLNLLRSVR